MEDMNFVRSYTVMTGEPLIYPVQLTNKLCPSKCFIPLQRCRIPLVYRPPNPRPQRTSYSPANPTPHTPFGRHEMLEGDQEQ